jgi:hypothetical protein
MGAVMYHLCNSFEWIGALSAHLLLTNNLNKLVEGRMLVARVCGT